VCYGFCERRFGENAPRDRRSLGSRDSWNGLRHHQRPVPSSAQPPRTATRAAVRPDPSSACTRRGTRPKLIAVTVDHVSNGRLEFGIGTGWNEPEFTQFGLPFPSAGDRVTMLDESLKALKLLWSEPRSNFKGRFYELRDAIAEPKPVQRPHPPIWIGSKGERMLRLTARHADVWHSNAGAFDESVALNKALDAAATKAGRDPASIRRSISLRFTTPDETLKNAKASIEAGFSELLVMMGGGAMPVADPRKRAEEAAALLPRLRALG